MLETCFSRMRSAEKNHSKHSNMLIWCDDSPFKFQGWEAAIPHRDPPSPYLASYLSPTSDSKGFVDIKSSRHAPVCGSVNGIVVHCGPNFSRPAKVAVRLGAPADEERTAKGSDR